MAAEAIEQTVSGEVLSEIPARTTRSVPVKAAAKRTAAGIASLKQEADANTQGATRQEAARSPIRMSSRSRSWNEHRSAQKTLCKKLTKLEPLAARRDSDTSQESSRIVEQPPDGSPAKNLAKGEASTASGIFSSASAVLSRTKRKSPAVANAVAVVASHGPCPDMATWKRWNRFSDSSKVFCCGGGYFDFRDAMLARGWVENPDTDSPFFDLKWSMISHINYDTLLPQQVVSHYRRNAELTTKVGLTLNLRNSSFYSDVDSDEFYPRAYNLYDPLDRAEFVLDFQLTHVESILRGVLEHMEDQHDATYSLELIEIAVDILGRSLLDLDDIIDDAKLAKKAFGVTDKEWQVFRKVCLDDVSRQLQGSKKKALEAAINKSVSRRMPLPRETKSGDKPTPAPAKRKKKRKDASEFDPAQVPLSGDASDFRSEDGLQLLQEAKRIVTELDRRNPQSAINGTRNAWIIKPSQKSRGRGIQMMRDLDEIFKATEADGFQWIVQKYMEKPQLPCGYKFDIRLWIVVTNWNPLTVYIWKQPYIRFAGHKYDASLENNDQLMHLVNNSIIKHMDGFDQVNEDLGAAGCMWFRQEFEEWLHKTYCKREGCDHCIPFLRPPPYTCETFGVKQEECCYAAKSESDDEDPAGHDAGTSDAPKRKFRYEPPEPDPKAAQERAKTQATTPTPAPDSADACENLWDSCVFPQMKDIVLWSLRTVMESVENRKGSVELYGYDFMLDDADPPKVWLIEVNSSPAMDYSTHVTTPLVKKVMEDTAKLLVDRQGDPEADIGEWQLLRHDAESHVVSRPVLCGKLEVVGKAIEKPKPAKRKKKTKKVTKPPAPQAEDTSTQIASIACVPGDEEDGPEFAEAGEGEGEGEDNSDDGDNVEGEESEEESELHTCLEERNTCIED